MDKAKKTDCRANGEVLLGVRRPPRPISVKSLLLSSKRIPHGEDNHEERNDHAQ